MTDPDGGSRRLVCPLCGWHRPPSAFRPRPLQARLVRRRTEGRGFEHVPVALRTEDQRRLRRSLTAALESLGLVPKVRIETQPDVALET